MNLKIIVDHRENKGQLPRYLYEKDIQIETKALEVGDFILSNDCVVELKKVPDFVNSLVDGRLFSQAKELRENFQKPLYIIEGDLREIFDVRNVHPNAIRAAMLSLTLDYQIPFLFSHDTEETVNLLISLAKREQLDNNKDVSLRGSKRAWTLEEQQQFLIEGLPLIGPKLAKNLLKEFKSPIKLLNALEDDLTKVEKLGPKKAKIIRELLDLEGEH
jgi:Fanconi anemia group M protein|tara:strand:- start:1111 stop:1761 length:651 start_codon:yes stop_codon:yes gene_type:complete